MLLCLVHSKLDSENVLVVIVVDMDELLVEWQWSVCLRCAEILAVLSAIAGALGATACSVMVWTLVAIALLARR